MDKIEYFIKTKGIYFCISENREVTSIAKMVETDNKRHKSKRFCLFFVSMGSWASAL